MSRKIFLRQRVDRKSRVRKAKVLRLSSNLHIVGNCENSAKELEDFVGILSIDFLLPISLLDVFNANVRNNNNGNIMERAIHNLIVKDDTKTNIGTLQSHARWMI